MNQNSGTSEAHEKAEALKLRPFHIKNLIAHGGGSGFFMFIFYAFSISISKSPV